MRILITAFDPFGGEAVNPSQEAVRMIKDTIAGAEIIKLNVPVVFGKSIATVYEAMQAEKPDVTLCIGQAGGRFGITPERVAINLDDARIADNDGFQPVDAPIAPDGPDAYFTTLPVREIARRIGEMGIPAGLSLSAGAYVCNHVMYTCLHLARTKYPGMKCGFVHVPYTAEMPHDASKPSLPLADIVRAVEEAVRVIAGEDA